MLARLVGVVAVAVVLLGGASKECSVYAQVPPCSICYQAGGHSGTDAVGKRDELDAAKAYAEGAQSSAGSKRDQAVLKRDMIMNYPAGLRRHLNYYHSWGNDSTLSTNYIDPGDVHRGSDTAPYSGGYQKMNAGGNKMSEGQADLNAGNAYLQSNTDLAYHAFDYGRIHYEDALDFYTEAESLFSDALTDYQAGYDYAKPFDTNSDWWWNP